MMKQWIVVGLAIMLGACSEEPGKAQESVDKSAGVEKKAVADTVAVTDANYSTAMSDLAMQKEFAQGASNTQWHHHRTIMELDKQPAPMMNRDTLYSFSILDGGGDVAITLPETDGRYQSLHVWNHDHVTYKTFYGPGRYVIPADKTSDFFVANVRTQVDASSPGDVKKVNGYQDQLKIEFLNGYEPKPFKVTNWNMDDFNKVHAKYVAIAGKEGVMGTMGTLEHPVSQEDRNRGISIATGLLPDKEAVYLTASYQVGQGKTLKATYPVPGMADPDLGFYSITIYGDDQYLHTDKGSTISNKEITLNEDGKSFDLYYVPESEYGSHDNELIVPTETFWINFRVYLPAESVISGEYTLPEPTQP